MSKTSVEVDKDIARQAAEILGTETLKDTINAALKEVVQVRGRLKALELLADHKRFDFSQIENAWGGDDIGA